MKAPDKKKVKIDKEFLDDLLKYNMKPRKFVSILQMIECSRYRKEHQEHHHDGRAEGRGEATKSTGTGQQEEALR